MTVKSTLKNRLLKLTTLTASITLLSGCYDTVNEGFVGDAENILFASNGALLVSGGTNLHQMISDDAGNKSLTALNPGGLGKCNFTGIAEHNEWVFATCVELKYFIFKNNHLFAARLPTDPNEQMSFNYVNKPTDWFDPLDKLVTPNGIAFSPAGDLLIADFNMFGDSSIARFKMNIPTNGEQPTVASSEKHWLDSEAGITNPNGLRMDDDKLYVSNNSQIFRFQFDSAGEITVGEELFDSGIAIIDDIMPFCGGVAITDYLGGRLVYFGQHIEEVAGEEVESFSQDYATLPLAFSFPSSIAVGQAPFFSGDQLLITEKGILQDPNSSIGNQLTSANVSLNLNDPLICEVLNES